MQGKFLIAGFFGIVCIIMYFRGQSRNNDTDSQKDNAKNKKQKKSKENTFYDQDTQSEEESVYECPITHEPIIIPYKTQCNHVFEESAITDWLKREQSCPVCRKAL
eukprot:403331318